MKQDKVEFAKALTFTAIVVLLAAVALAAIGCTVEEWRDVGHDALLTAPSEAADLLVGADEEGNVVLKNPDGTDYSNTAVSFLAGLAAGWYTRKFKEKRYAKKASGDVAR